MKVKNYKTFKCKNVIIRIPLDFISVTTFPDTLYVHTKEGKKIEVTTIKEIHEEIQDWIKTLD